MPVSNDKLSKVLYDLLPEVYKTADKNVEPNPYPLQRFLEVASVGLEHSEKKIDELGLLYNVDTVNPKYLPYLSNMLGFDMPKGATSEEMRRLIRNLPELYRLKGNDKVFQMLARLMFYNQAKTATSWRHRGVDDEGYGTTQLNIELELMEELVTEDIQGKIDRYNDLANFFRPVNVKFSWLIVFYYLEQYEMKRDNIQYLDLLKEQFDAKKTAPNLAQYFDLYKDHEFLLFDRDKVDDFYLLDTGKYFYDDNYENEIIERELLRIFMDDNLPGDYAYLNEIFLNSHGTYPYRYKFERYNPMNIIESFDLDTPMFFDKETYSRKWSGEGTLNKSIPLILNGMPNAFDLLEELNADKIARKYLAEASTRVRELVTFDRYEKIKSDFKFNLLNGKSPVNSFSTAAFEDTDIFLWETFSSDGRKSRTDETLMLNSSYTNRLNTSGLRTEREVIDVHIRDAAEENVDVQVIEEEDKVFVHDMEIAISNWTGKDVYDYFGNRLNSTTGVNTFTTASFTITRDTMKDSYTEERKVVRNDTLGTINTERTNSLTLNGFLLFGDKSRTADSEKLGNALVDTESSRITDVLLDTSSKNPVDFIAGTINANTLNNFTLLSVFDRMMADVDEGVETAAIHVSDTGGNISHSTLNSMLLSSKIQPDEVKAVEEHSYGFSMKDDFVDEIIYLKN